MNEINSYSELAEEIKGKDKAYLLLFKKGSEKSDCTYQNIIAGASNVEGLNIYYADVNKTRDIHLRYDVITAPSLLEFENGILKNVMKGCNDSKHYKSMFEDSVYYKEINDTGKPAKRVTVYSTPTCSWCNTLKSYLKLHKIQFSDIDISSDKRAAEELVRRSGQRGVPQTDINGEIIVGFNKKAINELLHIQE